MKPFFDLNLLQYKDLINVKEESGVKQILDPLRKKWVKLEPEELVRQLLIAYLIKEKSAPLSRMISERRLDNLIGRQRFDLGLFDREGKLILLAECKSFKVNLDTRAIGQLSRYNLTIGAPLLLWTNGKVSCCARLNEESGTYNYLESLPNLDSL